MRFLKYVLFSFIVSFIFSSCSTSSGYGSRTSKYARSDKRVRHHPNKKERDYVIQTKAKTSERNERMPAYSDMQLRDEIVLKAIQLAGRDYRPGGKNPESGFDCSGFTSYVFRLHGIQLGASSDLQAKQGLPKPKQDLVPGDLVFFGNENRISHVGIVASHKNDELEIIHSTTSAGVKIDNITKSEYWQGKLLFGRDVIVEKKDFQ